MEETLKQLLSLHIPYSVDSPTELRILLEHSVVNFFELYSQDSHYCSAFVDYSNTADGASKYLYTLNMEAHCCKNSDYNSDSLPLPWPVCTPH